MPNFTLGLNDNLPATNPSNQKVVFTRTNGTTVEWFVTEYDPNPMVNTSRPTITCVADLANQPNIASRTLRVYYPVAPSPVDHQIRTVQRA